MGRMIRTVCTFSRNLLLLVLLVGSMGTPCFAQSLWERRDPNMVFLFQDMKARRVGDLLTVVINENTDVQNRDARTLKKEHDTEANVGADHSVSGIFGASVGALSEAFSVDSKRDFGGNSKFSSERAFEDRITVSVIDVLPNGNLVIEGSRGVAIEGDERTLIVSGVVRGLDIAADNTVQSRLIANFQMQYEGRGAESHFVNQGWFSKAANKIWPF